MRVSLPTDHTITHKRVLLVQSISIPINTNFLAVTFLAQELINAGAQQIIGVIPYLGYSRQESSSIPNKPGPTKVIVHMLESAGIDYFIIVELHAKRIVSFFTKPIVNITLPYAAMFFCELINNAKSNRMSLIVVLFSWISQTYDSGDRKGRYFFYHESMLSIVEIMV